MADEVLVTRRLVLRPPGPDDLAFILDQMNTPAVLQFLGGAARSREQVEEGLRADITAFANGDWRRWTVFLRDGDRPIGRCGLFRVRTEAAPPQLRGQHEIGWTLAEAFWGKGHATEAASAVLGHAFTRLGLPHIHAQTSDSNARSTRLMGRLGFVAQPQLGYHDPDYPPADNPTTVWRLQAQDWRAHG